MKARRAIFERCLQHVSQEADRETQHPDLTLPTLRPSDILTSVSAFELKGDPVSGGTRLREPPQTQRT